MPFPLPARARAPWLLAVPLLAAGLAGCMGPAPEASFAVGVALPRSGPLAAAGSLMDSAVGLAAEEVRAAGGVAGRGLRLLPQDTAGDPARAAAAAEALLAAGARAIVGPVGSGEAKALLGVAGPARLAVLSPGATSPELTSLMAGLAAEERYFFRTVPSDALRGHLASRYATARGWTNVTVVHDNNPYGNGLKAAFEAAFKAPGRNVTSFAFEEGRASYADVLERALGRCAGRDGPGCPSGVFFVGYPGEAVPLARDWWARPAWRHLPWLLSDSEQSLFDQLHASGVGLAGFEALQTEGHGPGYEAYLALAGPEPPPFSENAYDAMMLVALAAERARGGGGAALRDALRAVANPPGEPVGPGEFARAARLLAEGRDIDYEGASGSLNLDANGDVLGAYVVFRIGPDGRMTPKCLVPEAVVVDPSASLPAACAGGAA